MPLLRLGPFVFAVPTFAVEGITRGVSGRAQSQSVIGAAGPTHLLGPNPDTLSFTSTFFPYHLNGGGLAQLRGIQEACRLQTPMMLVGINGLIYGRWVITDVNEDQSSFHPRAGTPQQVDVDMTLAQYIGGRGSGGFNIGFF